jgi:hypothetical protein
MYVKTSCITPYLHYLAKNLFQEHGKNTHKNNISFILNNAHRTRGKSHLL